MEGGQTQQGPDAPPRWLQFAAWLRQQAGGPPDEALSEASASDAEEAAVAGEQPAVGPSPAAETSSSSTQRGNLAAVAGATGSSSSGAAAPPPPGHLARHTMLAPRLPDCRAEMRLTSDSANRARQEMTVMLAAPGMSLNEAPVLTAKQASALMSAICEPLLSLPVGRLTRKLAAPTKLQPTDDRGLLTLWLLPDDSLSLVWQSAQQLAPSALDAAAAASASASASAGNVPASSSSSSSSSNPQMPAGLQQSCSVAVWEELAHFSSMAHLLEDAPVVTIHMLRGDASGRSFYIRVRDDVAEANLEAATAAVPDAKRLLQQQQQRASQATTPAAVEADSGGAPRMYFWLTDRDLGRAVYSLGRLKSLLKRPPTLAKRSGVPERQLLQLGAWLQSADVAAAAQQHQRDADAASASTSAAAAAAASLLELGGEEGESGQPAAAWVERQGGFSSGVAAAARARPAPTGPLSPLQQTSGLLLGHTMSQMHGGMAALLPPPPQQAQREREGAQSGAAGSFCSSGGSAEGEAVEAGPLASGISTVSATAAALYQDQRFNVVCPCTVSVVVSMRMQAAGANLDPDLLPAEASARARIVAERHAKSAVDRSGRQRIEERLAEVVIRNIRAQRNRARHHRQQQRDGSARDAHRAAALALAQQATGRTPAPADTSASRQQDVPAAAVAEKVTPELEAGQPCSSSPFALAASSSAEAEAAAGSAAAAFGSPLRASGAQAAGSGRAFSSPAALPTPAALLPGGRVTLGNLQSLLNRPRLDTASSLGSATSEQGAAAGRSPPVASGAGGRGGADHPSGRVSVADLAELLGKHAKLE